MKQDFEAVSLKIFDILRQISWPKYDQTKYKSTQYFSVLYV